MFAGSTPHNANARIQDTDVEVQAVHTYLAHKGVLVAHPYMAHEGV